ncbi:hypothetical protein P9112_006592 [Eukaryota sp. TZLM1-RC]
MELPEELLNSLSAESNRRAQHEKRTAERHERLAREAEQAQIDEASLAMKWSSVVTRELPEDLQQSLIDQKGECNRILDSKNELIRALQAEISTKDDEYTRALLLQEREIDSLLKTLGDNYNALRQAKEQELHDEEERLDKERQNLLSNLHEEIESLLHQRRRLEESIIEKRDNAREEDAEMLKNLRIQQAEDSHSLRMKYWGDLQHQDREIEQMRATYLLNIERLEYNHATLTQKSLDSEALLTAQKRSQSKMRDVLTKLKKTYYKNELTYKAKTAKNLQAFRRISEEYKDLQRKLSHFEKSNFAKFEQLFHHYDTKSRKLLERCFEIDGFVFSNELGLPFSPLEQPPGLDYRHGASVLTGGNDVERETNQSVDGQEESTGPVSDYFWKELDDDSDIEKLLNVIDDQLAFLCPDRSLVFDDRIAEILGILQIRNCEKLDELKNFFKGQFPDFDLIDSASVMSTILAFLNENVDSLNPNVPFKDIFHSDSFSVHSENKTKKTSTIPDFSLISSAFPPSHYRIWKTLNSALKSYKNLLTERLELLDRTDSLRNQNAELKQLVNNYLRSQINEDLLVPPSETIGI